MIVADPLTLNVLCNAILNNNRELNIHIFVPVYDFYIKICSFKPVLSIRIVLNSFYLLIFYSEKFST